MKCIWGILYVLLEVSGLSGMSETELVKEQAALLPQTYAAFAGSTTQLR